MTASDQKLRVLRWTYVLLWVAFAAVAVVVAIAEQDPLAGMVATAVGGCSYALGVMLAAELGTPLPSEGVALLIRKLCLPGIAIAAVLFLAGLAWVPALWAAAGVALVTSTISLVLVLR